MSKITKIINEIVWKDNWESKINDEVILNKWRTEVKNFGTPEDINVAVGMLKAMLNRKKESIKVNSKSKILDDSLQDFLIMFNDTNFKEISENFKKQIYEIEKNSDFYHPGTKNKVLDIIHPSLYCYVKGFSFVNDAVEEPYYNSDDEDNNFELYQWLPSEFYIDHDKKVKINSYINNLDERKYADLYRSIESIFEQFVPNFEKLLGINLQGNCQVITKIANINISPQDKYYEGGNWHIEGTEQENIIATGIYYYEVNNIINSFLEFRKALKNPKYDNNENKKSYASKNNLNNGDQLNKNLGKIYTNESGKCIVFPNYIQHKVSNFELKNNNENGTRKILVFFLINPQKRIISTKDVPIQQRHLVKEHFMSNNKKNVPQELIECILDNMNLMTQEMAIGYMKKLMLSRKYYTTKLNNKMYEKTLEWESSESSDSDEYDRDYDFDERDVSLCEH